ncbi:Beta-glucosidase A [[Clostridium] ultunense Esp]|nr:Beta-glucosidase A [[Clostridium] ultunense Esp]
MTFPKDFLWGAATAAYQVEGAAFEDGRGPSIWDIFSHTPRKTLNGDDGDVACDHYHRYEEDLDWMEKLGLTAYRFSVSWSRVLPDGKRRINEKGLDFYARLIDGLLNRGITPILTIYHWDLPQALQEKGGWANRDTTDRYAEYADLLFRRFGDLVPYWITHNEPWVASFMGHFTGEHAPGIQDLPTALTVAHHLLLSHSKAVEAFRAFHLPHGKIGITNVLTKGYPASDKDEDRQIALLFERLQNGWFLDPIFTGSYPLELIPILASYSDFSFIKEGDMEKINQPIDFLGINYYFRNIVRHAPEAQPLGFEILPPQGELTAMGWEVYPQGLLEVLKNVHSQYGSIPILITENGAAYDDLLTPDGRVADRKRIQFLKSHLEKVDEAIAQGIPVIGYCVWSLMDNFEWAYGYSKRFGLLYIDYATLKRIPKESFYWYRELIAKTITI